MNKLIRFVSHFRQKYWDPKHTIKTKGILNQSLHIIVSSIKGFLDDKCFDKASTLTFYTLLSIIPLMAIGFGIAQELGFADKFTEQVKAQLSNQPQIAEKLIEFSNSTLKTTKGGIIAIFGLMILLWTVFNMIVTIGTSFDEIWKVKKQPTLWTQMKRYVPMILFFPAFLVGSNMIILFMSTQALLAFKSIKILNFFSPIVQFLFELIPYFFSWGLISFIYFYFPNTKVSWKAALIAGVITGIIYVAWQWIYVTFQTQSSNYGAVYGGFAAFPLFLIWLNYSWLIILFGMELTRHIQKNNK